MTKLSREHFYFYRDEPQYLFNVFLRRDTSQFKFIKDRGRFEKFILKSDYYLQQISRHYRGALNAAPHICDFYNFVINRFNNNQSISKSSLKPTKFNFLISKTSDEETDSKDFTNEVKSEAFIRDAIRKSLKCKICKGFLHSHSITIDHKTRKIDGGEGSLSNSQLSHPFCNTTYKK